ncbi:MAG: Invasion associated locus B family protein [Xanthobacteraceae bacterium]|nr:Invasion associated locus B family protein [Xanthobacteraceae bacterium]
MTRRILVVCALVATLACAPPVHAQQQSQKSSTAKPAVKTTKPKPKSESAKPAAKSETPSPGSAPNLLAQFGEWGAYTATAGGKKVCFALAKPSKATTTPPNRPRDPPYMFISSRPSEKVKDEVSVIIGYGLKPNADASIDVGGSSYPMFTQNDGAWIKNPADEARLVDALRKGTDAVVKGTSSRGTSSTDTYPLHGLAQALDRVGQECQ